MKQSLLPRGVFIAVLFLFVRASSAISTRKLLNSAGALVDELESLRQRLVESTGFSQPQWSRKLQQAYYPTVSYGGYGYGYGYYGYYGAYSGGGNNYDYMMMGRRLLGDAAASGEGSHARALKQAYDYPYGYGGYYGYGYYYGSYGSYAPAQPYSLYQMITGRRRMLSNVERLTEILTDETDGFVNPADRALLAAEAGVEDPRRALKQMPYDAYPSSAYGYSYGYGYYYGGYYGANPYVNNPYKW